MVFHFSTFDHEIINVTLYLVVNDIIKILSHSLLVGETSILEAKMHDLVTINSQRSYKCDVLFIF